MGEPEEQEDRRDRAPALPAGPEERRHSPDRGRLHDEPSPARRHGRSRGFRGVPAVGRRPPEERDERDRRERSEEDSSASKSVPPEIGPVTGRRQPPAPRAPARRPESGGGRARGAPPAGARRRAARGRGSARPPRGRAARPRRSTPRARRAASARSRWSEVVASGASRSTKPRRFPTASGGNAMPRARPTASISAIAATRIARVSGTDADHADRRARDGADAADRHDEQELLPERDFDVGRDLGRDSRAFERRPQPLATIRADTVRRAELPDPDEVHGSHAADRPRRLDERHRAAQAADHALGSENAGQGARRLDAVLERDHERLRAEKRADRARRRLHLPGLHADEHRVDRRHRERIVGRVVAVERDRPLSVRQPEAQPVAAHRLEVRARAKKTTSSPARASLPPNSPPTPPVP